MNREHKYKTWLPKLGTFTVPWLVDDACLVFNEGMPVGAINVQYTGLKDKNGVEIYEGSLFHNFGLSGVCECVFYNGSFGYHVNGSNGKYASFISLSSNSWYEWKDGQTDMIEIIGDKYSNPTLLTPKS